MRSGSLNAAVMPTMANVLIPGAAVSSSFVLVVAMSLIMALCAQVSISLPYTPVPITGTTFGVLYAGALLGARRGAAAVGLYLLEGVLGLPFFAHGAAGAVHFAGPTGGYLIGFVPAAWATGLLAERGWDRNPGGAFAMMLIGSAVIFVFGLAGLSRFAPAPRLLPLGLYPFIPGDIAKASLSAALLPWGWKLIGKRDK